MKKCFLCILLILMLILPMQNGMATEWSRLWIKDSGAFIVVPSDTYITDSGTYIIPYHSARIELSISKGKATDYDVIESSFYNLGYSAVSEHWIGDMKVIEALDVYNNEYDFAVCFVSGNSNYTLRTVWVTETELQIFLVILDSLTLSSPSNSEPEVESLPGDTNSDSAVDMRDALNLLKYLASWSVNIDLEAADVNNDSVVDMRDALTLLKCLAGWNVSLI